VARYRKLSEIGKGGQGVVYRAERLDDGQLVAIKYLGEDADEDDVRRFKREVRLQASLDHPNILPVLGHWLTETPYFFVMPLAKASLCDRLARLSSNTELAISYFEQILAAMEHAHSNGVIHRDLKPHNILILDGPEGEYPVVSDFGLGRQTDRDTTTLTGVESQVVV
jgi:serine/threonine-protein kinase